MIHLNIDQRNESFKLRKFLKERRLTFKFAIKYVIKLKINDRKEFNIKNSKEKSLTFKFTMCHLN